MEATTWWIRPHRLGQFEKTEKIKRLIEQEAT
jgi:hypothetical protein